MTGSESNDTARRELYAALAKTGTAEKIKLLLDDLCTDKEVDKMAQRLRAAKLLSEGMTYNEVIEKTDISSATLSRVSRCVHYGKGYSSLFKNKTKKTK